MHEPQALPMPPEVVVAIVIRSDGRVLMIRRKQAEGRLRWSFPGGKINVCEKESIATIREVKEESGLDCKALEKIGQWNHPDSHKEISYWLCSPSHMDMTSVRVTEPNLIDEVGWFTPNQIKEKITSRLFPPVAQTLGI